MSELVIQEGMHGVVYLLVALIVSFILYKKIIWKYIFLGLFTTYAIDLDHLIDYFMYSGGGFSLSEFLSGSYFFSVNNIYLFLHSWELGLLLFIISWLLKGKYRVFLGFITLSLVVHLWVDVFTYRFDPRVYSIFYRINQGFTNLIFESQLCEQ
jgi:hypothetical protein